MAEHGQIRILTNFDGSYLFIYPADYGGIDGDRFQRLQFGEPIGRFQAVKHPLAERYVEVESFKSLLYYAAWALDERPDEAPLAVSRAKSIASDAFDTR